MDRESVLKQVEEKLRSVPGIIDVWFPSPDDIAKISEKERKAEANGACGGLMKFVNRGVWATISRQVVMVVVLESSVPILEPEENVVYIVDQTEKVIGEYLTPERANEYENRTDVCHISRDFIIYHDRPPVGEPFFVIPEVSFHYIDDIAGVGNVTSGSVSTPTDDWIRERRGYTFTKHWTHLVGFDVA